MDFKRQDGDAIVMHPIAHIRTAFPTKFGIPRQSGVVPALTGRIVFTKEYAQAEALLRRLAGTRPEEAVGLLLWDEESLTMRPLVLVKGSGTLVWETGCGSGSAAVGAYRAFRAGSGVTRTDVHQSGGVITISAAVRDGLPENLTITGRVHLGPEKTIAAELP